MPDGQSPNREDVLTKNVVCTSCDGFCPVSAKIKDGRVVKVATRDIPILKDVLCMKGAYAPKAFMHPDRILFPLKRTGERGDGQWQRVSWDQALDEIANKLGRIVGTYGPEALAVSQSLATGVSDQGLTRRFMNHVGSPNWISGVAYCMGNTAAVNRMVYGWYPRADIFNSRCIVLFGHDPRRHSWTLEYKAIRMAQANGAKLIVVDPRRSENAEVADIWLPVRAGTDAAVMLGMARVIVDEELHDSAFVKDWCIGFDALKERLEEYPLDRVAAITGWGAEKITAAARLYATHGPACIPWSPITDQQVSSTSAIRMQCILRALCGYVDVKGGDIFSGFHPKIRSESEIEMHNLLSDEQKAKQLGAMDYPVFTYRGMEQLGSATERVWGARWANLIGGCYMANPMAVFKAMANDDPYPVRAFLAIANNTLLSYANAQRIYKGLMKQELLVAFEHMMTPTAQICDYVLPGDAWLERPSIQAGISEQAMQPPGECRNIVFLWHELARRLGFGEVIPWATAEEMINYRLEPSGLTWEQVVTHGRLPSASNSAGSKEKKGNFHIDGFATPSGKIELYSSVLENLGFDPLPYYREAREPTVAYPLRLFVGLPDDEYFRTGMRFVPELRARAKDPTFLMSLATMTASGIEDGDWARLSTPHGAMLGRAYARSSLPDGLVRAPHGWWKPEADSPSDKLSGFWDFSDAQITTDDDPELIDCEQGIPHLKGAPCVVRKLTAIEVNRLETDYGPTVNLPRGPEGKVLRSDAKRGDFMFDEITGIGVEFEAVELSLYARNSS